MTGMEAALNVNWLGLAGAGRVASWGWRKRRKEEAGIAVQRDGTYWAKRSMADLCAAPFAWRRRKSVTSPFSHGCRMWVFVQLRALQVNHETSEWQRLVDVFEWEQ